MTTGTMKKWLQEIIAIEDTVKRINSAEFRAAAEASYATTYGASGIHPNPFPAMCGSLEGATYKPVVNAKIMLSHMPDIERLERIASAFESLDIDLSDESLKALELLVSERRYKYAQIAASGAIQNAISTVQDEERERESDNAAASLVSAGFVHAEDEGYWDRDDMRVTIESKTRNGATFYAWDLASNLSGEQVTIDSGKSGEFSRLLSAISPVAQEVKA